MGTRTGDVRTRGIGVTRVLGRGCGQRLRNQTDGPAARRGRVPASAPGAPRGAPRGCRLCPEAGFSAPRSIKGRERVGVAPAHLVHLHLLGGRFFYIFYLKLHFAASMSPEKLALSLGSRPWRPLLCSFRDSSDLLTPPLPPSPWVGSSRFTPGTPEPGHALCQRPGVRGCRWRWRPLPGEQRAPGAEVHVGTAPAGS